MGVDSDSEGGIREDKSSVRISVQLVRGADGSHVWSESFDMPRGDDLGMQAHVARTVERKLASHLAPLVQFRPDLSDEEMRLNSLVMQANYLVQRRHRVRRRKRGGTAGPCAWLCRASRRVVRDVWSSNGPRPGSMH